MRFSTACRRPRRERACRRRSTPLRRSSAGPRSSPRASAARAAARATAAGAMSTRSPRLHVLAGVNGAGKSSIGGASLRSFGGEYYNPDEAARALMAANPALSQVEANGAAWQQGRRLLERAIAERLDYAFETTLGANTIPRLLAEAASQGFELSIWYVGLASPELHIARVRSRVRRGGHDISEQDIRRRYEHSRLNLIHLM